MESSERIAQTTKHAPDPVLILDEDNRITYMNDATQHILQQHTTEAQGSFLATLETLPQTSQSRLKALITETRATNEMHRAEIYIEIGPAQNKDMHVLRVTLTPIEDDSLACYMHDITDLKRLAELDGLTGVYTRRVFDRELHSMIARAERYEETFTILLLDLDEFKQVNDTYGHAAGDQVLIAAAEALRTESRDADIPTRLGGDEFAVLLPHTTRQHAEALIHRLHAHILEHPVTTGEHTITPKISCGLAAYPEDGKSAEELFARVDENMYARKKEKKEH